MRDDWTINREKSTTFIQFPIKNREKTQETIKILTEKRKNLPSINAPENYNKTSQELAEMGYLHDEIMWGEDIDMFK